MPPHRGRLTSLQTLRCFKVKDEEGRRIEELGELKNLKEELKIENLEKVHDKEEAEGANLFEKPNIVELALCWSLLQEGERNDEKVLEGLQPHPNLKSLEIRRFCGTRFPQWTLKMAVRDEPCSSWVGLNNLVKIQLFYCSKCEEIPMMGQLPHLEYIQLNSLPSVRSIGPLFYGNPSSNDAPVIVFPALKQLWLWDMPNLTEWAEAETTQVKKVCPCLEELYIDEMDSGLPLANILGGGIKLPYEMVESCAPSLEKLSLNNLSSSIMNLPKIIECLDKMPRLRDLKIDSVPKHILSGEIESLRSLKKLEISPAASDSWDCVNMAVGGILKAASRSLDTLRLTGMQDWNSLPDQLQHLTALSFLRLDNFGIEELPEWFGNLTSLRYLRLYDCKKLRHLPSMEAMQRLTNLKDLRIEGCPLLEQRCIAGIPCRSYDTCCLMES